RRPAQHGTLRAPACVPTRRVGTRRRGARSRQHRRKFPLPGRSPTSRRFAPRPAPRRWSPFSPRSGCPVHFRRCVVRYAILVCAGALLAWCPAGSADTKKEPGGKFLTKDGKLTKELEVHEVQGGGLAAKGRRWTVKPGGDWVLAVRDVGVKE